VTEVPWLTGIDGWIIKNWDYINKVQDKKAQQTLVNMVASISFSRTLLHAVINK
jgi:hypothetical protein